MDRDLIARMSSKAIKCYNVRNNFVLGLTHEMEIKASKLYPCLSCYPCIEVATYLKSRKMSNLKTGSTLSCFYFQVRQPGTSNGHSGSGGGGRRGQPPPPGQFPESDYEEIGPPPPPKASTLAAGPASNGGSGGVNPVCDLCGTAPSMVRCQLCAGQIFCLACDDMYHRHPKRCSHARKVIMLPIYNEAGLFFQ